MRDSRLWLALIIAAYAACALTFSVTMPLLEGSDETAHFEYVLSLARGQGLPIQSAHRPLNYEAHHPPLYYVITALASGWIDNADYSELKAVNPYAAYDPLALSNRNNYIHRQRESFPFSGAALAMHLARLVGIAAGIGAILATYALARTLPPGRPALWAGAAAFTAFVPQFVSTSATINNDSITVCTAGLALWQTARIAVAPGAPTRRALAVLGALLALAFLSKDSGLLLAVYVFPALLAVAWWRGWPLRRMALSLATVALALAVLMAWWYLLRAQALGYLFGNQDTARPAGEFLRPDVIIAHWNESEISFWGLFGWNAVPLPQPVYDSLRVLAQIATAGLVLWAVRWKRQPAAERLAVPLLLGWVLVMGGAYLSFVSVSEQPHGRLFFPALPALAILLCLGWTALVPRKAQPFALGAVGVALCALTAYSATVLMAGAYPSPRIVAGAAMEHPLRVNFSDRAAALGYNARVANGVLVLDVLWQTSAPIDKDYTVSVQVFDEANQRIGHFDTFPVSGMHLTTDWRPGEMFVDTYYVRLTGASPKARLTIGLYDRETDKALQIFQPDGRRTARTDLGIIAVP